MFARPAAVEVPKFDDTELTFDDLQARIDQVLAFIDGLGEAKFEGAGTREVISQAGTPKGKRFTRQSYLPNYGLCHPAAQLRGSGQENYVDSY